MAPHSWFKSAVQAMRDIGIPSKTVKPVLRKLLELYDDNWPLIVEESYRALADAIFEQQDSQMPMHSFRVIVFRFLLKLVVQADEWYRSEPPLPTSLTR
ncbi:hypothetical protein EJ110_NYTH44810 [Nymphaea thermarum]|nr:hypothetical protein EJ110_NYTH44810 [Nymphaea thermarum]